MKVTKSILALLIAGLVAAGAWAAPVEEEAAMAEEMSPIDMLAKIDHSAWERGSHGGRFVVTNISGPKTFNDVVAKETSTTDITGQMYAGVVRRSQLTLEWEPGLAERWEISEDQKTITLHLRSGLVWSDGDPITADEIVWSVNEIYKNEEVETSARDALNVGGELAEFELIDDLTYRIVLPSVYAGIFEIASIGPMPRHIFEPLIEAEGAAAVNSFWGVDTDVSTIVGNGPFLIGEYLPSQRVVMTPNPNYYEKDEWGQQLPYLDEFVIEFVEDQDTGLARFIAGETDAWGLRGEDYGVLAERQESDNFLIYNVGPASSTQFITFNQNPIEGEEDGGIEPPALTWLSNKSFRQAMAHLIDRETIINNIAFGFGYPQYSFVWTVSPYYWEGAPDAALKYDPERARELLDSIGYTDRDGDGFREDPDGNKIELILNTNSGNTVREQIGELFTQEAQAAGIDVTFKPEAFNELVTRLVSSYDWHMILIGLTGSVDPVGGANVYPSRGNLHMIEPLQESPRRDWEAAVDAAWDEANLTTDEEQRIRGFRTLQELWIDEVPWAYTFAPATMHAFRNTFGNIKTHPLNGYGIRGTADRLFVK
ncbi:MAG: ABC transporter substrate-binding protein [Spirochaetaceae bacterium]|nr:ABC transporter substrate-binding protein [Spirochaetaceae bacterium]